jgi:alanine racemase
LTASDRRWAWVEVDLSAIAHNVRALKALTPAGTRFMAVVKADGYGHGAVPVARAALTAGATDLGVATVDEALVVRDAGFAEPLMLLSEPPLEAAEILLERDIVPTVTTREFAVGYAKAATARGTEGAYHLKLDTGMNRIGVRAEAAAEFAYSLKDFPGLRLEGTFTHFATADVPGDWDVERQLQRFTAALEDMRTEGVDPGIVHAANSPATVLYPQSHFDMVRCGIAIYGLEPSDAAVGRVDLRPAMSVKARATIVKRIGIGEGVSYGLTWQAAAPSTIATLPLGYADGVHRLLSNKMQVLLGGVRAQQVGRVCMDQFMVEVPRGVPFERGDEAILVGTQGPAAISMEELAGLAGTINYELACGFGQRLERVYR